VVHYLQTAVSDATHILAILKAHSPDDISRLSGFILVARTFDQDGTLRTHTLTMEDQSEATMNRLLEDCQRALTKD
jgi:hypothetical protein